MKREEPQPLRFALVSCSLDPASRSRVLAGLAAEKLRSAGHEVDLIDLRDHLLPLFDNASAHEHPSVASLNKAIDVADGVLIAAPIYNWSLGGAAKTFLEITGSTDAIRQTPWFDKVVTFLCAGGLPHSYMAHLNLANSMMLDFKCVINPYHVYVTERDFPPDGHPNQAVLARLDRTLDVCQELTSLLRGRQYSSRWEI